MGQRGTVGGRIMASYSMEFQSGPDEDDRCLIAMSVTNIRAAAKSSCRLNGGLGYD